jgi:hypothetical protein
MMEDNSGPLGSIVKADENYVGGKGATVVAARRSCGLDFRFASRLQVLGALRERFAERHPPRTQASSGQRARGDGGGVAATILKRRVNQAFVVGVSHGVHHDSQ